MADSSSIIREFSFSLGWDINEQAFRKYDQVLKNTDSAVLAVGASLAAAGVAAFEFTDKMANSMEKLYFATRRTGTTASEYQGFALAVQNAGGSAEGARQSLENLAAFTRNNPGGANLLTQLGVDPRHIGDAKKEMDDLAAKWRGMPFWQARMQAQMVGVDDLTLLSMQNGDYQDQTKRYDDLQKMFGMNMPEALKGANEFRSEVRDLDAAFDVFGQKLETELNGPMKDFVSWMEKALTGMDAFIEKAKNQSWHETLGQVGDAAQGGLSGFRDKLLAGNDQIGAAVSNAGAPDWLVHGLGWKTANDVQNGVQTNYLGSATTSARAKQAMTFFTSSAGGGYSANQAAALTAQIDAESSFNEGSDSVDPKTGMHHVGIAQWDETRRAEFRHLYGKDILQASYGEQLDFMAHELNVGQYSRVGSALRRIGDTTSASDYLDDKYEASGDGSLGHAKRALKAHTFATTINIIVNGNDSHAIRQAGADAGNEAAANIARNFQ